MKQLHIILFIFLASLLQAQTTYHISPDGFDVGDGSEGNPWRSLYKATSTVLTPGSSIYAHTGLYPEINPSILAAGVTIIGDGKDEVTIRAAASMTTMITLSSTPGTNGNQSISGITIDGDSLASFGIRVTGRNNVTLSDFRMTGTIRYGITFADQSGRSVTTAPTVWATGNSIHNFEMIDCGRDVWSSGDLQWQADAAIDISGQQGMEIHTFDIDNRTGGRYAYGIKGLYGGGWHRGLKIHDGTIRTNIRDNVGEQSFGFNIELWTGVGGIEIYNIDGNGAIDMGGYGYWDAYSYGFAFKVVDNILKQDVRPTNQGEAGLILECGGEDGMYFLRNQVENFSTGLTFGTTAASLVQGYDSVVVGANVFANIGFTSGGSGAGIAGYNLSSGVPISRFHVIHNVIHKVNNASGHGISFEYPTANTWSRVKLSNNIIYNAYTPIQFRYQTIDDIAVTNNITFGATRTITNSTSWEYSSWNTRTVSDNQEGVDPLFISTGTDFRLSISSPAIDAGTVSGLTLDILKNIIPAGSGPDIGAYEFMSSPPVSSGDGLFGKSRLGIKLKDKNGNLITF